ncbi:dihydroorotate dehydrogenase B catalytic subunit [candidate division KSB1 bacterium 4572_119]|nr:MAG: dihydroorotate dehydrogenase B catalytic subunit [candidate division KSB1 bacterium 4572_119]
MTDLSVKIGGVVFANPILTASGTFGSGEEFAGFVDLNKIGGIVTKAVSFAPRPGNPGPRIAETSCGILNSIGLANVGVERFVEEKLPFLRSLKTKVMVNIAGKTINEYAAVIKIIETAGGVDGYELNVSCPNVKEGGIAFGTDAETTARITKEARKVTDKCLIVKLTPNVTSIGQIALAAENAGADAISVINTLVGMAVDIHTKKPKLATITGGLSGPAVKPVALAKVFEVVNAVKIPVIGIGGIMNVDDVVEFLITGAAAVQIGTANFINPGITEKLVFELAKYCEKNQIQNINNLIGSINLNN